MSTGKKNLDTFVLVATKIATDEYHRFVTVEHLVHSVLLNKDVDRFLNGLKVNVKSAKNDFGIFYTSGYVPTKDDQEKPQQTIDLQNLLKKVVNNKPIFGELGGIDVIYEVIMSHPESFATKILMSNGLSPNSFKRYIETGGKESQMSPEDAHKVLSQFTENLNEAASKGRIDPLIGRETEVHDLVRNTARRSKNNIVITGEPGTGKTAIVEGLAKLINENKVPDIIQGSTIYSLDVSAIVAGTKYRGDMEERLKNIIMALETVDRPILFIDEIHLIMGSGAGGDSSMDIANILKPALARGRLRCIGSTTSVEYRKYFEKDKALMRRFQKLEIFEPSIEDTKKILNGLKVVYEEHHNIEFTDEAIDAAVELSVKYINDRFLPDKAIDLLDSAGATQRVLPPEERVNVITKELIENEISRIAKVPAATVKTDESEKLANLETDVKAAVFGQDDAVTTIVDRVIMARAGLREGNKTIGSYLLVGPTGTGKTELAKQISATMGIPLLKYDMSEYMEQHSVSKLIGSPPGYVGYGDGATGSGKLVSDIESNPFCVLLLDEFEKAHPSVYNIFLQIMDDGVLTSSDGKKVKFNNVILLMTSNAGATELNRNAIGFGKTERTGSDTKAMEAMFSPEFRNRLDAIVKFNRLDKNIMTKIVDKFVDSLNTMASEKNVTIELSDDAKLWLADKGYDPLMGARPLARVIDTNIKLPLSKEMLFGSLKEGGIAYVDVAEDKIIVTKKKSTNKKKVLVTA